MHLKALIIFGILIEAATVFGKNVHRKPIKTVVRTGDASDPNYYRLPNDIIPMTYDVKMIPIMEVGNFSFTGTVTIQFLAQNSTSSITLHTKGLNVTEHSLYDIKSPNVNISMVNATNYEDRDFHVLYLGRPLTMGSNYSLTMKFKGMLQEDLDGFYVCSYENETGGIEWMAVTQFEAISARKAFPCFDESRLKAKFTISIARPKDMTTLSNMPISTNTTKGADLPPGYVMDIYQQSPKMSTYLVAFAVSKFAANPPDAEKKFRVWSRKKAIKRTSYSAEVGPKVLDVMKTITSINYTLPKMDLVAVPDFAAGAMENWGMVTFRETDLLYQENTSTSLDKQQVITVVAHELSHQWFGDLVSPEWWSFLWLNEGFAEYWMYVVTDLIQPTWRLMEQFVQDNMQTPFISDAMEYTKSIVYNVVDPNIGDYSSSDITYGKGSSVIRMMEHVLTREVFFQGLSKYLKEREFSSVNQDMLFDVLQKEVNSAGSSNSLPAKTSVGEIWSTWTLQTGYPVVTVNRNYEEGKAIIDQKRFVLEKFDYNKEQRWWIPLSYTTEGQTNFNETRPRNWISPNEANITIGGIPSNAGWVIFNVQSTGYYRVNYDEQNWGLIISCLKSKNRNNIHPVNRGQLLDDALSLARGGYINYHLALNLSQFLANETDFIPWYTAYNLLDFLDMEMSSALSYSAFKAYMADLLETHYVTLKFNESSSEDHVTRMSRSMLLPVACKYAVGDCEEQALKLFRQWQDTKVNTIPPNLQSAVYCTGIANGGLQEWNFLWSAYENTTIASEKKIIMEALACSKNGQTLAGYLNKTVENDSKIRLQDRKSVFQYVYTKTEGLPVALDFLTTRFNDIKEKCGMDTAGSIISGISSRISSIKNGYLMLSFFDNNLSNLAGAEEYVEKAKKYIDNNLNWLKNYEYDVSTWLNNNYPPSSSATLQASMMFVAVAAILTRYFY